MHDCQLRPAGGPGRRPGDFLSPWAHPDGLRRQHGPGLFAIFAILLGVKLVTNDPGHMHSLLWVIWLGNAAVAVLDAILIGRLLRQ